MSDTIRLAGIECLGRHGVLPAEHVTAQRFVVDLVLEVDLEPAGRSDDLGDTVSYADIALDVVRIVSGPHVDLIEALAAQIADAVLQYRGVEAVEVTVNKPDAPIEVPFGNVAVRIRRERSARVVVALGANLGDPRRTLAGAVAALRSVDGLQIDLVSDLYETDPVGGPDQPVYLNAVLIGHTRLTPAHLLRRLHEVEARFGRVRVEHWGPRTLDLDLVQFGDPRLQNEVVENSSVVVPHPRAHERRFVLVPWAQIDPTAVLTTPAGTRPIGECIDLAPADGVRRADAFPA